MLKQIDISNFALIDNVNLQLHTGYSTITGETGAGKSILLKALNLLLGERADYSIIKSSEKKCVLEAVFSIDNLDLKEEFDLLDIDYESETVIRREFNQSGKSRLFINDSPVSLSVLKLIGEKLVKIHTQHETLDLLNHSFQLNAIDIYAKHLNLVDQYKIDFKDYKLTIAKLETLVTEESEQRKELDYTNFLLEEFNQTKIGEINLDELFKQNDKIENWSKIQSQLQQTLSFLSLNSESASTSVKGAVDSIQEISNISNSYLEIFNRLDSVKIELDDIETELESELSTQDINDEEAHIISEQVSQINSLLYKHNVIDAEGLLQIKNDLENKLLLFSSVELEIESLKKNVTSKKRLLDQKAKILHKNRMSVISAFESNVKTILSDLGMPDAVLKIELINTSNLIESGYDKIDFLFKTNKGGAFLPISKTASGGELSRLMLSILHITSSSTNLPTLIFDEIDTGVSGEIAAKMANLFNKMGENCQLIAITHLPQIAGKANHHFYVSKSTNKDKTNTKVRALTENERIIELAKMMSGESISDNAIETAKTLLNND